MLLHTIGVLRDVEAAQEHDGLVATIASNCYVWSGILESRADRT